MTQGIHGAQRRLCLCDYVGPTPVPSLPDVSRFDAQGSTNFANWAALSNVLSLTNGSLLLLDPAASTRQSLFYRVVEH